jgi:pimeloyl-ACP methyl ester carboxylesterase
MTSDNQGVWASRYISRESLPALHFRDSGQGDVACLFVHGLGEGGFVWHDSAAEIAPLARVVAIDLRGHGDSEWEEEGRYDIASYVSDVSAVIGLLQPRRFILIGHSLGGEVALTVAVDHRESLAALILVDFSPQPDPGSANQVHIDLDAETRSYGSPAEYRSWLSERRPLMHPAMLDRHVSCALRQTPDGAFKLKRDPRVGKRRRALASVESRSRMLWQSLAAISCPALVIRGAASAVLSQRVADRMAANALSKGQLKVVKMAGHAIMADNPDGFTDVLRSFVFPILKAEMD